MMWLETVTDGNPRWRRARDYDKCMVVRDDRRPSKTAMNNGWIMQRIVRYGPSGS